MVLVDMRGVRGLGIDPDRCYGFIASTSEPRALEWQRFYTWQ